MKHLYRPSLLFRDGSFRPGSLLVQDGAILAVGGVELERAHPDAQTVDWHGLALVPGTVNTHCHSFQSLLRGFVADAPFLTWRDRALYRYAPYLDADALYAGALLSFGEMLRHGVTTVADFFYVHNHGTDADEAVIKAARDVGIRLMFARTMYDWSGAPDAYQETIPEAEARTRALAAQYQGDSLVSVCPAPHSLHGASAPMIQAGHRLAAELGTRFHIHIAEERYQVDQARAEYGCRPVEVLDHLGVADESLVAVHLCWLAAEEIALLGGRRSHLAYCPSSNMFLADGVSAVPELLEAGVETGLGTDGACSNNRLSIFEEMRMAALLQKVHRLDATALSAACAFDLGTRQGGRVLDLPVGELRPGFRADLVGIDLSHISLQPVLESTLLNNVVYAMQPDAVQRVVVEGREVVRGGCLQTVPEETIVDRVAAVVAGWPRPEVA